MRIKNTQASGVDKSLRLEMRLKDSPDGQLQQSFMDDTFIYFLYFINSFRLFYWFLSRTYSVLRKLTNFQVFIQQNLRNIMKKNDSLSKNIDAISMDRKATVKKYEDLCTFWIYENGAKLFKTEISANSTVGQLVSQVKQRLAQNSKDYIGLISRDGNEIIDYTLKMKNFPLSSYAHSSSFQVQRKQNPQFQLQPSLSDFEFLKLLGSGVSASVYLVRHKTNGILYALKQINKAYFKDFKRMQQVLRQRKIMIEMITDIPFTSKLVASFQSQKFLNLLLEYYPGGEMFFHLQKRRLLQEEAKLYVAEMIITFEKLHEKKIIYRDLKPENIMVDFEGHARLGDYGLCKINLEYYDLTYSFCGSQQYMAPEVRSENGYNYSVDFYTLGSFAYELVSGVPPYYNNQPIFFQNSTDQFAQMIKRLIEPNMHKRLKSFNQIKRLKWFKNIQWKKVLDKKYEMPFKLEIGQNYIGDDFKHQVIDPEVQQDDGRFDKLLECFFYMSTDKGGISEAYGHGRKKEGLKRSSNQGSIKKKRLSIDSSNQNSKRNDKSKNSHRSSKSGSKQKVVFRRKIGPSNNIYTGENLAEKSSKKLFSSNNRSKSQKKSTSIHQNNKSSSNNNNSTNKMTKPVIKQEQISQKLKMNNVKSSSGLMNSSNTYKKVIDLQNVFSPNKMKSPKKFRPTNTNSSNL